MQYHTLVAPHNMYMVLYYYITIHIAILLGFLFCMLKIASTSVCPEFQWQFSLDRRAVPTGIERQMFARVLLGNVVISILLVVSSVNWEYQLPVGCFDR